MKKRKILFFIPLAGMILSGCDFPNIFKKDKGEDNGSQQQQQEEQKKDFTGVALEQTKSVYYDGEKHSLSLTGVPEGATVTYDGEHEFTEVGEHHVKVTISKDGYNDLVLEGTLTILPKQEEEKKDFTGIVLESSKQVQYDGKAHSLELTGVPEGATVTYDGEHEFTEVGEHHVKVTISKEGYNDLVLEGVLTITDLNVFTGISLESSKQVYYDGEEHSLELTGVPEGAKVIYEGDHVFTEVGSYHVKVTISAEGYHDLVLEGDLVISSLNVFEGITLESEEIYYDGEAHSLSLEGVPEGATVTYDGDHEFSAVGVHNVSVTISKEHYESLTLNGTLTIKALEQFTGVSLTSDTVAYDGQAHSISVVGAPEGATVTYGEAGNSFVNPGVHNVTATVSKENYEDLVLNATLTIAPQSATQSAMVDDFEGIGDSDLNSDWKLEYYNNAWVVPSSASISIAKNQEIGDGENSMKFSMSHQGNPFKATRSVTQDHKKYSGISLDARADSRQDGATMKAQVQVWYKDLPLPTEYAGYSSTYATYTLANNLSTNWTHFEIPFDDPTLSIASGAIPVEALGALGFTPADLSLYIEKVAVLLYPNYLNGGPKAYAYVDNVKLDVCEERVEQEHVSLLGKSYSVASSDGTIIKLDVDNEGNAKFGSLNLENNFTLNGTVQVDGANVTLVAPTGVDKSISYPLKASFGGSQLRVNGNPSGDLAALAAVVDHLNITDPFMEVVKVDDFESYSATGVGLDQSHSEASMSGLRGAYHSDYYAGKGSYTSLIGDAQWQLMGSNDYLELESTNVHSGSKAANFKGSTNQMRFMSFGLAKGDAQPIGRGNKLSLWVKSSVATTMNIRAWYVNKVSATNQGVTSGDAAYLASAPVTTEWTQITVDLDAKRDVYGFSINPAKAAARIYVDDAEIIGNANPYAEYVAPAVEQTIEDGKFGVVAGTKAYSLEISNDVTTATFGELGQDASSFTCEMADSKLTLKDTVAAGAGVTVVMDINNGELTVSDVSGAASAAFEAFIGGTLKRYNPLSLDFQNETADRDINDSVWKQEKYNSGWVSAGTSMRVRHSDTNFYVNMATGYSMDYRYTYTPEDLIGPANHLSAKIANDFSGCTDIKVKVRIVKADNSEIYVVGDASNYVTIPANTGNRASNQWYPIDVDFDLCMAKAVIFTVRSSKSGNDYLYVDDLAVGFKAEETPEPVQYKTITDGKFYIWNAASDCFLIDVDNGVTTGSLGKVGSDSYEATVSQSEGVLTIATTNGLLTVKATIGDNEQLTVTDVSGAASSLFSASLSGKTAKKCADINMDFSEGSGNGEYVNSKWTTQKYDGGWVDFNQNLAMNSKQDKNGNKIINLKASDGMTRTFTYTPDLPIGPVNHLDIDLGNYYTGGSKAAISYKIALLKSDGSVAKYIAGDADNFATLAYDDSNGNLLVKNEFDFDLTVGYKLKITTKCSGTNFMYVDNLHLFCK